MKKIYFLPILILILLFFFLYRQQIFATGNDLFYYSPCDTPIAYSIGRIDEGFNVTKEELITDAKTAANIWSNTQGKQLFVYDPEAEFTINMVYDTRQELTSKINDLDTDLREKQSQIDPKIEDLKRRQNDFSIRVNKLNEEIQYWNSKGGAPKEEYDKLVTRQKELQQEASALNNEARLLGQEAQDFNLDAQELNKTIDDYQFVLNFKPEEGLYEQDGGKRKISIYIDVDKEEFLHTLTHEFGHALGLNHVNDKEAIMYPQTTADLTPVDEEIDELTEICKQRNIVEVAVIRLNLIAEVFKERFIKKPTSQ